MFIFKQKSFSTILQCTQQCCFIYLFTARQTLLEATLNFLTFTKYSVVTRLLREGKQWTRANPTVEANLFLWLCGAKATRKIGNGQPEQRQKKSSSFTEKVLALHSPNKDTHFIKIIFRFKLGMLNHLIKAICITLDFCRIEVIFQRQHRY